MLTPEIKSRINQLWDKCWSSGIANPVAVVEQISYLIYMKQLELLDDEAAEKAREQRKAFHSIFKGSSRSNGVAVQNKTMRWSYFRQLSGNELLEHVAGKVFPFIKMLDPEKHPFSKHLAGAVFLIPVATLLEDAIMIIDSVYEEIQRQSKGEEWDFQDSLGDVYEYLLNEINISGCSMILTPRHIIHLLCGMVQPATGDRICDPACGTGGLLLGAWQYILTTHTSEAFCAADVNGFIQGNKGDGLSAAEWKKLVRETFYGGDTDISFVRMAVMNMMLHGIRQPRIAQMDSLVNNTGSYSLVMSHLPAGPYREAENSKARAVAREVLFIQHITGILAPGGRAAVIVPAGLLVNMQHDYTTLRKQLLQSCRLQAVISVPSGILQPVGTEGNAILLFSKPEENNAAKRQWETKQVWFCKLVSDGYSLDERREKLEESPLPGIAARFHSEVAGSPTPKDIRTGPSFMVPAQEIADAGGLLDMDHYRPVTANAVETDMEEMAKEVSEGTAAKSSYVESISKVFNESRLKKILADPEVARRFSDLLIKQLVNLSADLLTRQQSPAAPASAPPAAAPEQPALKAAIAQQKIDALSIGSGTISLLAFIEQRFAGRAFTLESLQEALMEEVRK